MSDQYEFVCNACPVYGTDKCDREALWCSLSWLAGPNAEQMRMRRLFNREAVAIPELNRLPRRNKTKKRSPRAAYDREYYVANRERKLTSARDRHRMRRGCAAAPSPQAEPIELTTEQKLQERLRAYRANG